MSTLMSMLSSSSVICVLLAGAAVVSFMFLYRGARLTPEPWYANENLLATILVPIVVLLLVGAGGAGVETVLRWENTAIGDKHLAEAALLVLPFAGIALLLRRATPKGTAVGKRANVVAMPGPADRPRAPDGQPPRPLPVSRTA
jgi:hypothetical protein